MSFRSVTRPSRRIRRSRLSIRSIIRTAAARSSRSTSTATSAPRRISSTICSCSHSLRTWRTSSPWRFIRLPRRTASATRRSCWSRASVRTRSVCRSESSISMTSLRTLISPSRRFSADFRPHIPIFVSCVKEEQVPSGVCSPLCVSYEPRASCLLPIRFPGKCNRLQIGPCRKIITSLNCKVSKK